MPSGARVVVGVSGGADSLALAIVTAVLARRGDLDPLIVHVHHHLRGTEADIDARHVEECCARIGLPFAQLDVHPSGREGNLSARAREARYRALSAAARDFNARYVTVAHHSGDQFETILMALCRGSEAGVSGLRWSRPIDDGEGGIKLIRPLLDVSRADCEDICRAANIPWREDSSNRDISKARARVRAEVVPILESLWPGAASRAMSSLQSLARARDFAADLLTMHFGNEDTRTWDRATLAALPSVVLSAGIRRAALAALGAQSTDSLPRRRIDAIVAAIHDGVRRPRRFALTRGVSCVVRAREIAIEGSGT
jgi:tRNA(Ile)-lysidine synthase